MAKINPYNFVPLRSGPIRKAWRNIKTHERLEEKTYSGHLILKFTTLTPVFTPSTLLEDVHKPLCRCTKDCREKQKKKTTYKRFCHRNNIPLVPATSLKGMIRAVFEALTNSCMTLFAGTYKSNTYPAPSYKHDLCNKVEGLCPACSVFGTTQSDQLSFHGKVRFSDALGNSSDLKQDDWILKELSSPKPEHVPFYAKDGKSPKTGPRGRKFYYHHDPEGLVITQDQDRHNHLNVRIKERLKKGATLYATLDFQGLIEPEIAALLYTLELDMEIMEQNGRKLTRRTLAHKIGMAKPLGLGSIGITIIGGYIHQGAKRYRSWENIEAMDLRATITTLKEKALKPKASLLDLLSRTKYEQGDIEYPDKQEWFDENTETPLSDDGVFEPDIADEKLSDPLLNQVPHTLATAGAPIGKAPAVKPEEQAAWLKQILKEELVLVTQTGNEIRRPRKAFQAKDSMLQLGQWYILWGTSSVRPPPNKE